MSVTSGSASTSFDLAFATKKNHFGSTQWRSCHKRVFAWVGSCYRVVRQLWIIRKPAGNLRKPAEKLLETSRAGFRMFLGVSG